MATVKQGQLTSAAEWWKHLRWTKRQFWKAERQAEKVEIRCAAAAGEETTAEPAPETD